LIKEFQHYKGMEFEEKAELWGEWSKERSFSQSVLEKISMINASEGLPDSHTYGYKIMYYALIEEMGIKELKTYFTVDEKGRVLYK